MITYEGEEKPKFLALEIHKKLCEEIKTIKERHEAFRKSRKKFQDKYKKIVECKEKFAKLRIYSNEFQVRKDLTKK